MRSRDWILALGVTATVALLWPMQERVSAQSPSGIVISQVRFHGTGAGAVNDEFIELFNTSTTARNITGWMVRSSNNNTPPVFVNRTITANFVLNPGCYFLLVNSGGYTGNTGLFPVPGDQTYTSGIADNGGAALLDASLQIVDQVGLGTAAAAYGEGTRLAPLATNENRGYQRNPSVTQGYVDSGNNSADFHLQAPSDLHNSSSACLTVGVTPPPVIRVPHEIQGAGATSPFATGTAVNVRGVVTALKSDGFFLQSAPGMEDADDDTSEGLFVSATGASLAAAHVGHLVTVTGAVAELVPDAGSASVTALNAVTAVTDGGVAPVPASHALTTTDLAATGTLDQLERFEGMRVSASLTAVSGTDSDGAFFAVLTGQARTFREPGVESGHVVLPCAVAPCNIPLFDGNPERVRVDSDGLGLAVANVSTGAVLANVVGPLDFSARAYTLLPESALTTSGGTAPFTAPAVAFNQFTIASFNMQRFAPLPAAAHLTQLVKASATIRDVMNTPDIVGLQGVEDLTVLAELAARIDSDAAAAGQSQPQYFPYLVEGSDPAHLNVAFLVKKRGGRVAVDSVQAVGADADFEHPPLVLRARVGGVSTSLPQDVTVIVNHLASLLNVDQNTLDGDAARAKRQAQALSLANYIQGLQINNPAEAIVSLGDYNAFSFNDGYADLVGTVRGVPTPGDQVAIESPDLVSPDLTNVGDLSPAAERYSSVAAGNAQALDHMLVSATLLPQFVGMARPRVNADFPESLRDDATTPSRLSDRDPMVAYFLVPPDVDGPVFTPPEDQVVEATGPDGAVVLYDTPAAHDNLDPSVDVVCTPASGTLFGFGNTGVHCTTQDVAGNPSKTSFTVTVHDTTAPALTVSPDLTVEAESAAGSTVSFTATATDAVTPSLNVTCTPASGTVFALGTTVVQCSTHDDATNEATASFSVTVHDTTAPALTVSSDLTVEAESAAGSTVSFTATATDAVTPSLNVTCTPASGTVFALGTTVVHCSTHDDALNGASASFSVTVSDTTAPALTVPSDFTVEAQSAAGRTASFATTASDTVTPSLNVSCTPASGSVFALGTTLVQCSTHDAAANAAHASFSVTVRDTTPPVLSLPSHLTETASSPSGKSVSFVATAADAVTASPAVTCTPASGSTFPVGDTLVSCVATDAAGNASSGSFTVTITNTVFGHMAGTGDVLSADSRFAFAFDVRESPTRGERGWLVLQIRNGGNGRPDRYFAAQVTDVRLSTNAGVDTVVFSGCGAWNGRAGYRYEITATDRGEPGRGTDTFALRLYAPTGELVETVSATLRDGNIKGF